MRWEMVEAALLKSNLKLVVGCVVPMSFALEFVFGLLSEAL